MGLAYWIIAALLAVFYLYAGGKKVALALIQVGGIAVHLSRGEARQIGLNIGLLAAAAAAAWLGTTWL
jgi:hypothetical protein